MHSCRVRESAALRRSAATSERASPRRVAWVSGTHRYQKTRSVPSVRPTRRRPAAALLASSMAGRYHGIVLPLDRIPPVSIPARPAGRALRESCAPPRHSRTRRFNPRPARWPGATSRTYPLVYRGRYSFNPRPARWPGATVRLCSLRRRPLCFNPRPARWPGATPDGRRVDVEPRRVSIPARPAGRALLGVLLPFLTTVSSFNPRPARWPGATARRAPSWHHSSAFQSPPGPLAGRYRDAEISTPCSSRFQSPPGPLAGRYLASVSGVACARFGVSIPARPAGRALLCMGRQRRLAVGSVSIPARPAGRALRDVDVDQHLHAPRSVSIPARPAGRALRHSRAKRCESPCPRFNPRPARWPGATSCAAQYSSAPHLRFNPRPARWPGATAAPAHVNALLGWFQSPPGPLAGRYGDGQGNLSKVVNMFQSPPGPLAGRYPAVRRSPPRAEPRFNPRPARWPGATLMA